MSETTFTAEYSGCLSLSSYSTNYTTTHDKTTGDITEGAFYVGQYKDAGDKFWINRGFVFFDTSTLPDNCLIESAKLKLVTLGGQPDINSIIVLRHGNGAPHNTFITSDYLYSRYSGNGGSYNTSVEYPHEIESNDLGKNWINRTGWTKLAIISENDIDAIQPDGDERIRYYGYNYATASYRPQLEVEYYEPTGIPAIQSVGPCIDKQSTTMTAVGNVTDDGGGYVERGFEYYEDSDEYNYEMYAVRELGIFTGTGNFEMTINGLKPETTYQIRAWVRNSYGTAYGEWYTCTTTAVPSYSIYTESNDANYKLYLSDDEAIAWQGYRGPFNGKQKDINVTDLVNKTPGVKVLKLVSDARGTFHITITVKQNIKS